MSDDLISRKKAYEVLTDYYHQRTPIQHKALREALGMVPSSDIDLSDYSDRLWRNAYERGKADAEPERKKGRWVWLSSTYDRTPCEMLFWCSECHHETVVHTNGTSEPWEHYCPNCGADMRGGGE